MQVEKCEEAIGAGDDKAAGEMVVSKVSFFGFDIHAARGKGDIQTAQQRYSNHGLAGASQSQTAPRQYQPAGPRWQYLGKDIQFVADKRALKVDASARDMGCAF